VLDLVPRLAMLYFTGRLKSDIKLTGIQSSILLAVGLQRKDLTAIEEELSLPSSQLLAMFIKIMRKLSSHFSALVSGAIEAEMPKRDTIGVSRADASGAFDDEVVDTQFVPLETGLEEELEEGGDEALKELREKQRELIDALPLDQYRTPSITYSPI
jgi:N-acetyltransferase 10